MAEKTNDDIRTINDVPIIVRREIEARMIAPFIRAFAEELGEERTRETIRKVVYGLAEQAGKDMAEKLGENTPESYVCKAIPAFAAGGALEYEIKEAGPKLAKMDVLYCAYVDMYRSLGLEDLGFMLSCERDIGFLKGFNPDIEFIREDTLMNGAPYCDYCLKMKEGE